MKMLFKLYLLGQLIALPFMVGAIGGALGGGTEPSSASDSSRTETVIDLRAIDKLTNPQVSADSNVCDAVQGGESLGVLDNYQQLNVVIADLDGDTSASSCFDQRSP